MVKRFFKSFTKWFDKSLTLHLYAMVLFFPILSFKFSHIHIKKAWSSGVVCSTNQVSRIAFVWEQTTRNPRRYVIIGVLNLILRVSYYTILLHILYCYRFYTVTLLLQILYCYRYYTSTDTYSC